MTHRSGGQEERRAQIIEAALSCFARRGYANTTMDDIAAEAGVSKGTLYWYFEGKDDLLMATLTSVFEGIGEEAMVAVASCETAADKLRTLASAMIRISREAPWFFNLFIEFWAQSPRREEAGQAWAEILARYAHAIGEIVEGGVERGEFRPVDGYSLAWALLAAYDGLSAYISICPDLDAEQVSETFIETVVQGLRGEAMDARGR
ncbi:MAG TPA: TetR/AcrR family transcriptional regulator [Thermoflexia bacterium]|jgi:AcrR family transcriptional regulator|nr:TetR/AcrR family transcriptional regulator [Thermoflexia bacterium]